MQLPSAPVLAVLALVAVSPWATAQSEQEVVARFRAAFSPKKKTTTKTAPDKTAAAAALDGVESPAVVETIVRAYIALEREASPIEAKRATGLKKGGGRPLADERRQLRPIRRLQDRLLKMLRQHRDPMAVRTQVETVIEPPQTLPLTLELTLARRAGDLDDDDVDLVRQQATGGSAHAKKRSMVLLVTLQRLGERARTAAPWVITQLENDDEAARVRAASALQRMRAPESLEPLVARLEHERGRTLLHLTGVLKSLTGQSPGNTATSWQLWLRDHGGPYVRGEVPLGARATAADAAAAPPPGEGTGSYFGIPQDGQSILYVFDNSNSMNVPLERGDDGSRRIHVCKEEVRQALQKLSREKTFNIVAFANKLRSYGKKMTRATPKNVKRAEKWLEAVELEFETNGYDALDLAFAMAGRGTQDRYYETEVDTIFFLSDGAPTTAAPEGQQGVRADAIEDILAAVRRWNPYKRVTIHAVGLGLGDNQMAERARAFLGQLAQQNGGRFIEPR